MPVRTAAERYLRDRLPELELGERVTLARTATAGLVPGLIGDKNSRVVAALLNNPRLREVQVLQIAEDPRSTAEILRVLADSERWASRPAVRTAVIKNKRTPVHTALQALAALPPSVVAKLVDKNELPPVVRLGAERILSRPGATR